MVDGAGVATDGDRPSHSDRYRLLALDVDGTLLGPDHQVRDGVPEALAMAQAAGLRICIATGRSHVETVGVWRRLGLRKPFLPMILVGGALICEPDTGRTVRRQAIPRSVACEFDDALGDAGYPSMAFVDRSEQGFDYILTQAGDPASSHRDWFAKMDVEVRRVERLSDAPDLPTPLRISTVVDPADAESLAGKLREQFGERLNLHAIVAPNYGVTIVEAFAAEVSKLVALRYVAAQEGVPDAEVAAVGDDVNDISMVSGVGLGAAMPDSAPSLIAGSNYRIKRTLATFIRDVAAGRARPQSQLR
jgi:5-amino-6-(5-phospho-D-ribitylamino)uracil phosphatase